MTDSDFAKTHLREHLSELLLTPISEGFWSIAESAKDLCERNNTQDQHLRTFQNMLTKIPEWTDSTLSTEVERIQKATKCSYLDDLLMGVFIAYMKSFASLHYRGGSTELKIDFDRPTLDKFIHELYKQSARKLWQVAYLFKTAGVTSEQQARNRQDVQGVISRSLEEVIRSFLPWQAIAKKYFTQTEEEQTVEPEPEVKPDPKAVTFGSDSDESDEEDEEEDEQPKLILSDEAAVLDIPDLEASSPQPVPEEKAEEVDPMKELESKMSETLVLNL